MLKRFMFWMGLGGALLVGTLLSLAAYRKMIPQSAPKSIHVVLVGASIGQAWRLPEWSVRVRAPEFSAESIAVWQFDKTPAIEDLRIRPAVRFQVNRTYLKSLLHPPRKPDVVILKECSAYFPGDLQVYESHVREWVRTLRSPGTKVMLATVVPVTNARAHRDPGKQESLLAFNRWLREYAGEQAVPLLDLEACLRADAETSYLRDDLAAADGSHLNASAYVILDRALLTSLRSMMAGSAVR